MEFIIVERRLGLLGNDIQFNNEDFFGLKVGENITQIGNGKENGSFRTDFFEEPLKYVGSLICNFNEPEKMFAFKYPEKVNNEDVFRIYGNTGSEIFTEAVFSMKDKRTGKPSSYVRFFKPVFTKL